MERPVRPGLLCAALILATSPAAAQGVGSQMDAERRGVMTEKDAFLLLPAQVICEPITGQHAFSDSGRYLLMTRQAIKLQAGSFAAVLSGRGAPPIVTSILVWDAKARETRTVWKGAGEASQVRILKWLPGQEVALALVSEGQIPRSVTVRPAAAPKVIIRQSVLRILPGSDRAQSIAASADSDRESLDLSVSPIGSMAILQRTAHLKHDAEPPGGARQPDQTVAVIGADARIGKSFPLAPDFRLMFVDWAETGAPILHGSVSRAAGVQAKALLLDPKTGAATEAEKPVLARPAVKPPLETLERYGVRLKRSMSTVKEGQTALPVGALWLESIEPSEQPRALVSADTPGGFFSPNGDAILFQSQGALLSVPLERLDKQMMIAAREAARRAVVMSNAKQLGLAAHMFAQDNDDTLPSGEDITAKLSPYLKNTALFEGFSYTFSGGSIADVDKPAETELGFVTGSGGRAVIYVDGHVKWKPDK